MPRKYGSASLPSETPKTPRRAPKPRSADFPVPPSLKAKSAPREASKPAQKIPKVRVNLQLQHSVNGLNYGPGSVLVDENLANLFMNTEQQCAEKEMSLVQQQAFIIRMGRNGPVKQQVPWAQFDSILSREELPVQSIHQTI